MHIHQGTAAQWENHSTCAFSLLLRAYVQQVREEFARFERLLFDTRRFRFRIILAPTRDRALVHVDKRTKFVARLHSLPMKDRPFSWNFSTVLPRCENAIEQCENATVLHKPNEFRLQDSCVRTLRASYGTRKLALAFYTHTALRHLRGMSST